MKKFLVTLVFKREILARDPDEAFEKFEALELPTSEYDSFDIVDIDPPICSHCSGSGEGRGEGSKCDHCNGRGSEEWSED